MTKPISKLFAQGVAIAIVLPTSALADLSAIEVWESWKSLSEAVGQEISVGSQETSNGALILNDVTMTFEFPEGQMAGTLEFLEFRERSDGTVAITMAPDVPFSMTVDPEVGEAVDMAMIMHQTGTSIIASGETGNVSMDFLAAEIGMRVDKFIVDGEDVDFDLNFIMADIDGKYLLKSGDQNSYVSDLKAASMTYSFAMTDPEEGGHFAMKGSVQNLVSHSDVVIPEGLDMNDPAALFTGGFNVQGGFSAEASNSELTLDGVPESFAVSTQAGASALDVAILDGVVQYGGSVKDVAYSVSGAQIPFPEVNVNFAELAFNLLMPMIQSEEPKDFGLLVKMGGMEISDMIWGMFDPGQVMPRDPATISFDVSGAMNWLVDITDPTIAEDFEGETPVELHSLKLNDVTLSAAGAEITGDGDFTFDNSDLETFDGIPAPTGAINLSIIGANGLMDRLIQMGFLQQDQAMGARMMLGLFARPAGGEDALTSTIEVNGDGSVFANGQQLR